MPVIVYGTPGRMRDKRRVLCYVPVDHDVPVLTDHAAPIALTYVESDRNGIKKTEEFRGYEGRLFRAITTKPAAEVDFVLRNHPVDEDGLFAEAQTNIKGVMKWVSDIGKSYAKTMLAPAGFADLLGSWGEAEYRPAALTDLQVKDYDERDLANTVEEFRKKIAKLVIVDDRFYLSEPEPVMRMTPNHGDVFCHVVRSKNLEFGVAKGSGRDLPSIGFFSMGQIEEMMIEGHVLATTGRVFSNVEDVAVYDPTILKANTEAMSICEVAAGFAQRFLTQLLPDSVSDYPANVLLLGKAMTEVPLAQIALYQRLVGGVELFKRDGDPSEVEAAVMAVLESDERALERFYFLFQGSTARFATEIVRRWNDREVSLDSDFQLSTGPFRRG
ncbi:hypothetical protein HFO56_33695 [Rhizobium laguerreae]|uniref:hypothetical protein n=1 Tax=Rhizobium laguerreae TaxID=1076926 RepID=UPI001C9185B7|nr:hypothetical protein [Rhizobium laguerreae]MBY3157281.1 hypothetical protein [Rhizobium laguerreae]